METRDAAATVTLPDAAGRPELGCLLRWMLSLFLIAAISGCASTETPPVASAAPKPRGILVDARFAATATVLPDGTVLIAGGVANEGAAAASAEIYDPSTGGFALTDSMLTGRAYHTATLLNHGKVLICGGIDRTGAPVRTSELYDPAQDKFEPTGNLLQARYNHTATLLKNGKVLITGGDVTTNGVNNVDTAELYDPATERFSVTGNVTRFYDPEADKFYYQGKMIAARGNQTATLLQNGDVLIAGGGDAHGVAQASAAIYHADTGKFTPTGSMHEARQEHRATLLPNGQVLVTGGLNQNGQVLFTAELYNPATGGFTLTTAAFKSGTNMTSARYEHTATPLPNGTVLIAGGSNAQFVLATAEIYHPAEGLFTCIGGRYAGPGSPCNRSMNDFRNYATATLLRNGTVLIAGGYNFKLAQARNPMAAQRALGGASVPFSLLGTAEVYNPAARVFSPNTAIVNARYAATAAR
ncbi:MAG: Kelch repeat-containing protein [Candidatus Binataceae bacterium]